MMSEPPPNIQAFNRLVLLVLTRLYESFPRGIDLDAAEVGKQATENSPPEGDDEDVASAIWDEADLAADTLTWLQEEGFIRMESGTLNSEFVGVRLSMRGIAIMGMPSLLDSSRQATVWDQAKGALKEGSKKAVADAWGAFLLGGLRVSVAALLGPGGGGGSGGTGMEA